jgi:hypothetical protein
MGQDGMGMPVLFKYGPMIKPLRRDDRFSVGVDLGLLGQRSVAFGMWGHSDHLCWLG